MSSERGGRLHGPAYVLHTLPWRETSLLVEVLTRDHGRLALMARGARRPRSPVRGVLRAFQPLDLEWFGKGELRTLSKADWGDWQPLLEGQGLYCGLYLNELMMRLLARDDPHPGLYDAYGATLAALARRVGDEVSLRRFELRLLTEIGYGLQLDHEADTQAPLDVAAVYSFDPEHGPRVAARGSNAVQFSGRALAAIAADDWSDPVTGVQAKALMRLVLSFHLGQQDLHTRKLFREITLP
ncbi:MAG: DNA repair protein RecO [Pseudomonadota bacterium]|nr:DNA repair protein RecO [Pseudomonadota bacterium]